MSYQPAFDALLDELGTLGFCGGLINDEHSHVTDYIPQLGTVTADQFVQWLFLAEGDGRYIKVYDVSGPVAEWRLGQEGSPLREKQAAKLVDLFIRHMGSDCIDASAFQFE